MPCVIAPIISRLYVKIYSVCTFLRIQGNLSIADTIGTMLLKNQESRIKNYFAKREHTTIINITKE